MVNFYSESLYYEIINREVKKKFAIQGFCRGCLNI